MSSSLAQAQTRVRVVAETRIDVAAERAGNSVQVVGVLRDDLGQALPHRELSLVTQALEGDAAAEAAPNGVFGAQTLLTDERGEFTLAVPFIAGRFMISCNFAGDEFVLPARVERTVDPRLADVRLHFDLSVTARELDLDMPGAQVRVRAESSQGAEGLELTLRDELGRLHGSTTTDAQGFATFELRTVRETRPGPGRWLLECLGDARRAAAQAELPILRVRATVLSAQLDAHARDPGETATLSGTLHDSLGRISGGTVGIFGGDEHVMTVVTDERGGYRASFEVPERLASTSWMLEARFAPETPGLSPSTSPKVTLQVTSPWPVDWLWLSLPLGLSVLALLVARRRERLTAPPAPRTVAAAPGIQASSRPQGAHRHDQLAGRVLDHQSGAARIGAIITLTLTTGEAAHTPATRTASAADGRFVIAGLAAGVYRMHVTLPGYVPLEQPLTIPHRGEWSDVLVRIESYRARALSVFRRVGRRFVSSERVFETTTNRELPNVAPEVHRRPLLALAQLTDHIYYGPVDPAPGDLPPLEHAATVLEQQILPAPTRGNAGD